MNGYDVALFIASLGMVASMVIMINRIWHGPSAFDRLNALALIGTDTILLLSMIGMLTGQIDHYVDISITYALIGFISLVIIARYITKRHMDMEDMSKDDLPFTANEEDQK